MSRLTVPTAVRRFSDGRFVSRPDVVAGEEPLEIRVDGVSLTTTMRTPGADIDLVHGFLHAEGVITAAGDVREARYCDGVDADGRQTYNVLDVERARSAVPPTPIIARSFPTTSACGVCGSASIEALQRDLRHPLDDGIAVQPAVLQALPDRLRERQRTFQRTGGVHAAALVTSAGEITLVREDVGRHNAVDKVIGALLLQGRVPVRDAFLLTSSRASYELVQKAAMAGVGLLVAVSAPSSLAVDLARATGMTLVGFTSSRGFNVYCGPQRIVGA
ncbi:formate dehydrogenase accessory sulfurtransferase FdhD [Nakamurella flava]|uniref:Sulfur carrier protein FdhD n=1 Tax=Nakamurella flava TaxID=2576308 RepID=A0A4V6CSE0_9ACTN|nr:formate dehydrogenase accessory sulfurtransferase FdhD [Nakamurella flava]TKV61195.1 formate dehydrogenase accessory sulfurtransferase FdhD [Nakamurella flava]